MAVTRIVALAGITVAGPCRQAPAALRRDVAGRTGPPCSRVSFRSQVAKRPVGQGHIVPIAVNGAGHVDRAGEYLGWYFCRGLRARIAGPGLSAARAGRLGIRPEGRYPIFDLKHVDAGCIGVNGYPNFQRVLGVAVSIEADGVNAGASLAVQFCNAAFTYQPGRLCDYIAFLIAEY